MRIVIKIGTHALLTKEGAIHQDIIDSITSQIARLQKDNISVILVSSGAVAFGRLRAKNIIDRDYGETVADKQLLASLGQHELMRCYADAFQRHGLLNSQLLLTRDDFHVREHSLNIERLLTKIMSDQSIVPIINENDSTIVEGLEHGFSDNDELAGAVAKQINADKLILLTNVSGVFDKDPEKPDAKLIKTIYPDDAALNISTTTSKHGRGGMASKLATARKVSTSGIMTHIANANESDVILKIMAGDDIGTTILGHINEQAYTEATTG